MRLLFTMFIAAVYIFPVVSSEGLAPAARPAGLQDRSKKSIAETLHPVVKNEGVEAAVELYYDLKKNHPDEYDFGESELNRLGYALLQLEMLDEAIEIFKLNVEAFPEARNTYDSLAEGYLRKGELDHAKKNYIKALEIDPAWDNPKYMLNKIYIMENYQKREYMVPMRDGVKLFTQVYSPGDGSEDYPFLMKRTPYSVSPYGEGALDWPAVLGPALPFAREGFIFVYQDVRGRYMSEGEFIDCTPYITNKKEPADVDETTDTYDTVEWLLNNIPNNNGRIGMWGISYPGFYAVMGLIDAHPAMAAVSPQAPVADMFVGDDWHHNGAFFIFQGFSWIRNNRIPRTELSTRLPNPFFRYPTPDAYEFFLELGPISNINTVYFKDRIPYWNDIMEHGTYDEYWKSRNTLPHLVDVTPAVMTVGGWFDAEDLYGPLKVYKTVEQKNPGINNTLVMGPWYHGGWAGGTNEHLGDVLVYNATAGKYYREKVEFPFFNYYLKGMGELNLPEALVYETGSNEWRSYDRWPPDNVVEKNLYLWEQGKLSFAEPEGGSEAAYDEYLSDPAKPIPHTARISNNWSYHYMHEDQRFAATRPDVLVYESDVLEEDVTIAGPIVAELYVSTTGADADWVVKLIDVYPSYVADNRPLPRSGPLGGYQQIVRGEVMRGKFRNSLENPEPFEPGVITEVEFELQDINHTFLKGHKIMVQVQSSWFPLVDRNTQTFVDIYKAKPEDFQKAFHRVYRSAEHSSHLKILVVQR